MPLDDPLGIGVGAAVPASFSLSPVSPPSAGEEVARYVAYLAGASIVMLIAGLIATSFINGLPAVSSEAPSPSPAIHAPLNPAAQSASPESDSAPPTTNYSTARSASGSKLL